MDDRQIIEVLEERGGSWKDLLLVGDPPAVSRWTPQGNLYAFVIEDGVIWRECVDFLRRNGARQFVSADEAKEAFLSVCKAKT